MKKLKGFLYKHLFKKSRLLYNNLGVVLILFLILFSLLREFFFIPIMSKIWGLALATTPDGFISTSNLLNTLFKSPWIIPIGLILVIMYVFIAMWQISAIIVGISYVQKGEKLSVRNLFKVSLSQIGGRIKKENWMMLIYALVITPLVNVYQASDMISRFVIPEYIQDYINSRILLSVLFVLVALAIIYVALRWLFLFPVFILKKKDFKEAKEESDLLTEGNFFRNGINISLYSVAEFIRLSVFPIILILLPVFICYILTSKLEFSTSLFATLGITLGLELAQNITGTLVQISAMCFLVNLYIEKQKEKNLSDAIELPPMEEKDKTKLSINRISIYASVVSAFLIALVYLITVFTAQQNPNIILKMFGKTEIIAHKGYSSKAPENTMPAFELADKSKIVDFIELDVWSTKDGIPVVIHNSNIKEATGVDKEIYDCTYDEIKDLPATYHMDKEDFRNARIPTLEEVIETYASSTPLLIEIKGYKVDTNLPRKIVDLMKEYNCDETCYIHSGDYKALEAVKMIDPYIRCGLILAMVTGNYYDLPYADFYSIEHTFVNQSSIAMIHRRGKEAYAWTVNYDESIERLRFTGVDGLITDVPDEIANYVGEINNMVNVVNEKNSNEVEEAIEAFLNEEY